MTEPTRPVVTLAGQPDVLGSPVAPERPRNWQAVLAAVTGVTGVGVAATGVAMAVAFGGGGPQPEDVLPADVFAMVKVDLDPAGGQKVAAYRLAQRFPDLGVEEVTSLQEDLLRKVFADSDIDYAEQLAPWVGARAALAVAPDADDDGEPEVLVAVAYEDREQAERLLPEVLEKAGEDGPSAFAFSERASYVLLARSQQAADAAAEAAEVLADSDGFADDLGSLDGDQVAVAWADLGAAWDGAGDELRELGATAYGEEFALQGSFVAGVHLEDDAVELSGVSRDIDLGDPRLNAYALGQDKGTGLVTDLPEDAVAAYSAAGLGQQLEGLLEVAAASGAGPREEDLAVIEEQFGLAFPEDLVTLLGDEVAVALFDDAGEVAVGARTRSPEPDEALPVAQQLLTAVETSFSSGIAPDPALCGQQYDEAVEQGLLVPEELSREDFCAVPEQAEPLGEDFEAGEVTAVEDGIAYGTDPQVLEQITGGGGLGETDAFRRAVPDAGSAVSVLFADLQAVLALMDEDREGLEALEAVGISATGGADARYTARLTLR